MFAGSTGNIANSVLMLHGVVLKFSRIRERCFCFWFRFWPLKDRRCEDSPSWNTWPLGPGRIRKSGQPHSIAILDAEVTVFAMSQSFSIYLIISHPMSLFSHYVNRSESSMFVVWLPIIAVWIHTVAHFSKALRQEAPFVRLVNLQRFFSLHSNFYWKSPYT